MAASKATVQRQKSAEQLVASGRTHDGLIGEAVGARHGAPAGTAASLLVTAVTDDLEAKAAEMVRCDEAHEAELRDDPEARELRDRDGQALGGRMVESREQLTAICGSEYVAKLGFSGKTPVDPVALLRLGETVVSNLGTVTPPASRIPGYHLLRHRQPGQHPPRHCRPERSRQARTPLCPPPRSDRRGGPVRRKRARGIVRIQLI